MIQVEHLTKRYGDLAAVDDVSFRVGEGEVVGFLGPNGAGKSTVMRILTSFLPATSGKVRVAGHDPFWESMQVRLNVGYLPENVPLYREMRVSEYLFHRSRLKRVPSVERKRRISEVLSRCGITEVSRRVIGQLSKGYRQRVGLADALINDPPILILDEPTVGLDPNQVRLVREMIRELGERRTVLLSTHILSEVAMICPRVMIISEGRIVAEDRTENLTHQLERSERYFVQARGPADELAALLADLPGMTSVAPDESAAAEDAHAFIVEADEGAGISSRIVGALASKDWPLVQLSERAPTLEDVFVNLTSTEDVVGHEKQAGVAEA